MLNSCFVIRIRADLIRASARLRSPRRFSALYWHTGDIVIRLARAMPPRQSGSTGPVFLPSEWARRSKSNSLIADDGAALVTYPIPEAQIVDPHVGKTGAHRRCGT